MMDLFYSGSRAAGPEWPKSESKSGLSPGLCERPLCERPRAQLGSPALRLSLFRKFVNCQITNRRPSGRRLGWGCPGSFILVLI